MELQLSNFKQFIPKEILQRGKNYYNSGQVIELSMDDEGEWQAQVEGSDVYDVTVVQDATGYLSSNCTCPYEFGLICKHVAAVLYAIEESYPEYVGTQTKKTSSKAKKKPNRMEQLEAALRKTSQDDLVKLVLNLAQQDKNLLNTLLLQVGVTDNDPASYERLVKNALRAGRADHGYIDYRGSQAIAKEIGKLFTQAQQALDTGQHQRAVMIYKAVIEHLGEAYHSVDDSGGNIGGCIADAIEGLREVAELVSPDERRGLFDYCLLQGQQKQWRGFDFQWDFLDIASVLIDSPADREKLFAALDNMQVKDAGFYSRFEQQQIAHIKLDIIRKFEGEQAAQAFIDQNLELDDLRMERISELTAKGDFETAKQLAKQGITRNEQQRLPGLVSQYRDLLLNIAEKQRDTATIIQLAREFLFGHLTTSNRSFNDYYQLLKKHVPNKEWEAFLKQLLRDVPHEPYRRTNLTAQIYAIEGMWFEIFDLVRNGHFELLEHYRIELESRFPAHVVDLYERQVYKMLEHASNRGQYQVACEYLSRMKRLGHAIKVQEMVELLSNTYKTRRALIEELRKV